MAERYDLTEIMLDKFPQLCLELNSLSGCIDPVLRTLGSFCFCPHCTAAAAEYGLDLKTCQEQAPALAAQSLAVPPHVVNANGIAYFCYDLMTDEMLKTVKGQSLPCPRPMGSMPSAG